MRGAPLPPQLRGKFRQPMNFSVAGASIDHAEGDDILALLNTVWYKVCSTSPHLAPKARPAK